MSKKNMEEELKNVIEGLADAFESEAKEDYLKNHKNDFEDLNLEKISSVELFLYKRKTPFIQHVKNYFFEEYNTERDSLEKISFLYENFNFIDSNVEKLVDLGRGCCVDKAHYIIKTYINEHKIGVFDTEFLERTDKDHHYWEPDFGTKQEWFNFIDSLMFFYYGNPEKYNAAYKILADKKDAVLKEIEREIEICKNYLPTFEMLIEENKDKLPAHVYERCTNKLYKFSVVYSMVSYFKDGIFDDEIVLNLAIKYCEKYA